MRKLVKVLVSQRPRASLCSPVDPLVPANAVALLWTSDGELNQRSILLLPLQFLHLWRPRPCEGAEIGTD